MKEASKQDQKLGRGLSALLGDSKSKNNLVSNNSQQQFQAHLPQEKGSSSIDNVPINKIIAGVYQPRRSFHQDELEELSQSIKEHGVIQPILLRKSNEEGYYEIIAGERRYRAAKLAGITKMPAIIKKINNHEALEIAIIENVQRADLSLIEEAHGYKQLMDEFSYGQEHIAQKTGKSRSHIANILRLLTLPKSVHALLEKKLISMGHARAIINSKDPETLAKKIVESALTVREAEEIARDEKVEKLKNTPLLVRTESKIKFINSGHLTDLENQLATLLDTKVKISYNQFKSSGKIAIDFSELEKIYYLVKKLTE